MRLACVSALALALEACEVDDQDCRTARELYQPVQPIGAACTRSSYGECAEDHDDCAEGTCRHSDAAGGLICTVPCDATGCERYGLFCGTEGTCEPAAQCGLACSIIGYCCCTASAPGMPTECGVLYCGWGLNSCG